MKKLSKYDKNNTVIHYRDPDGVESWGEYDENNNLLSYRDSTGYEVQY